MNSLPLKLLPALRPLGLAVALLTLARGAVAGPTLQINIDTRFVEANDAMTKDMGVVWGLDRTHNTLWKLPSTATTSTHYQIPTANSGPGAITVMNRYVYFTETSNGGKIAQFDPSTNTFHEYVPTFHFSGQLGPITQGPDHKLWIGETSPANTRAWLTRLDPASGVFDPEYIVPGAQTLAGLTKDQGGSVLGSDPVANKLFRISSSWQVTPVQLSPSYGGSYSGRFADGCWGAGTLWMTWGYYVASVAIQNSQVQVNYFDPPLPGTMPYDVAVRDTIIAFTAGVVNPYPSPLALGATYVGELDVTPSTPVFTTYGPYTVGLGSILPLEPPRTDPAPLTRGAALNPGPPVGPPGCPAPSFYVQVFPVSGAAQLGSVTFPAPATCSPPDQGRGGDVLQTSTALVRGAH